MKTLLSVKQTEKVPFLLTLVGEDGEEEVCRLSRGEYEAVGSPLAGTLLNEETEERIKSYSEAHAATSAALRILSFGDNNQKTLSQKLKKRGFSEEATQTAIEAMQTRGYIDEKDQVYRLCVSAANRKLWGPRKILLTLLGKGYAANDVKEAIARAVAAGEIDFTATKRALLEKKGAEDDPQKIRALLYRYGF